jgi:hypothetical protein
MNVGCGATGSRFTTHALTAIASISRHTGDAEQQCDRDGRLDGDDDDAAVLEDCMDLQG